MATSHRLSSLSDAILNAFHAPRQIECPGGLERTSGSCSGYWPFAIAGVADVAQAFVRREVIQQCADPIPQTGEGPPGRGTQQRLQFAESILDRIEIR